MKVYFLLNKYYPDLSASASLVRNLISQFGKHYSTNVVATVSKNFENSFVDEINVIRLNKSSNTKSYLKKKDKKLSQDILFQDSIQKFLLKEYDKYNTEILLIPITFLELIATINLKKNHPEKFRLCPFILEYFPSSWSISETEELKEDMVKYVDYLFVLPKLKGYFYNKNVQVVEHPMIVNNTSTLQDKKEISLSYIGGVDRKNRNPINILNIIFKLKNKLSPNYHFYFYGYGNLKILLLAYSRLLSNFTFGGVLNNDEARRISTKSNFLITIGNKNPNLVPSKIFDCISTGRPIIHFRQNEDDPYEFYLKKYPCYLILDLWNIDDKKLLNFITQNTKVEIDFNNIHQKYQEYTPQYIFEQFKERINTFEK
ncbi:hypothetical protein ABPS01_03935 [Streptococcus sp. ZJ151]|uniref:hypothetical protein n=1 Tax=Streptococcus jiangjianxini TaxID=3161189 RepID=UPI0032EE26E6